MKYLTGILLGVLTLTPALSFAQATSTLSASQKQSLIALLEQELQVLENEIAQIISQQQTLQTQQQTVLQEQENLSSQPVFGNTGSTQAADQTSDVTSALATTTEQTTPQPAPYVYVDPLLPQWEGKLTSDIVACENPETQNVQGQGINSVACAGASNDAITEAKLAINAGMSVSDADSDAQTISGLVQSLEQSADASVTTGGPSAALEGTAAALQSVASNWQEVMSILTTRVWQ